MTTIPALVLLLVSPAAAGTPAAMSATLEALKSQAAVDPRAGYMEGSKASSGRGFDGFTIQTLAPVEFVPVDGRKRAEPPPEQEPAPRQDPRPKGTGGGNYYFEGRSPVSGITIYTPKEDPNGGGSTAGEDAPNYGKYGKIAMGVGAALGVAGLVLGGGWLAPLAFAAGLLIGAGALLSFLFRKRK